MEDTKKAAKPSMCASKLVSRSHRKLSVYLDGAFPVFNVIIFSRSVFSIVAAFSNFDSNSLSIYVHIDSLIASSFDFKPV